MDGWTQNEERYRNIYHGETIYDQPGEPEEEEPPPARTRTRFMQATLVVTECCDCGRALAWHLPRQPPEPMEPVHHRCPARARREG